MQLQYYLRNSPLSRHTFRVQNAGSGHGLTGSSVNRETSASERGRAAPVECPEVLAMSALSLQNWLSAGFPSLLPMSWVCVAGTTSQCSWPSNAVLPWHGCPLCCPIAPIRSGQPRLWLRCMLVSHRQALLDERPRLYTCYPIIQHFMRKLLCCLNRSAGKGASCREDLATNFPGCALNSPTLSCQK